MTPALIACTVLLSYLVGAIPFGYAVARGRGVDILLHGSGNIGATNVGRVLGRRFGLLVLALDFAKGALPVAAARWLAVNADAPVTPFLGPDGLPVLAGLAAFLGHLFPLYLRFRGGKGVATGAGAVAVLLPGPALGALLTWLVVVCASRYVSLASVTAAAALCGFRLILMPAAFSSAHATLTGFCFLAAALVIVRHRANLRRLLNGTENQVGIPAMPLFLRTLHVLAVGLWFGSAVFFNLIAAPLLFQKFEALATTPSAERAILPLPPEYDKEMGTRLAGAAVSPIFPWFFLLEGVCGFVVALTAWGWARAEPQNRVHRLRSTLALLALATVVAAWPLSEKVSQLRFERYNSDPQIAAVAKAAFGTWHLYSLLLSLVTLGLVTVLMALVAQLPNRPAPRKDEG
jgi:acyl-phosphate glycerol 3-phosphate acyltransferase